jgi:hypothetical protein
MAPRVPVRVDQAPAYRVARELNAIVHAELVEDVCAVVLDRLGTDDEGFGDLLGGVRLGDQFEHLGLAGGKRVYGELVSGCCACETVLDQRCGGVGVEEGLAAHGRSAGFDEVVVDRGLQDVP